VTKHTSSKSLIVNADDFGRSHGINRGIIQAHEQGIVTSASLMVRWSAAREAAEYARAHPGLSVGLHFDLGEWACRKNGKWVQLYRVADEKDEHAVAQEAQYQFEEFQKLLGRDPTHIDSHQHMHMSGPSRTILSKYARALGVPLRACSRRVRYRGSFYGQNESGWSLPEFISVESLLKVLARLGEGWTELGCHPGLGEDYDSMYLTERQIEVKTLCDARIRAAIAALGIELRSYHNLNRDHRPGVKAKPSIVTWSKKHAKAIA